MGTEGIQSTSLTWSLPTLSDDSQQAGRNQSIDLLKRIDELVEIASALHASNGTTVPKVLDADRAPAIDGVTINFSPEDMAAALQVLRGKTQDAQMKTAQEGLQISKTQAEQQNERAMGKIKEWIAACEDAAAKQKASEQMDWVAKIGAFIGAIIAVVAAAVLTVATAGAAAPLLAVAVLGLVGATMNLASAISQKLGGPAVDLGTLMTQAATAILTAVGVPADKIEAASKVLAGVLAVVTFAAIADPSMLGTLAGGIAQLAGADATQVAIVTAVISFVATIAVMGATMIASGGSAAVGGIAKLVQTVSKVAQSIIGIASGVTAAVGGAYRISAAYDEHTAATAQADKKAIDAIIAKLGKQMEDDREELKKVVQQLMDSISVVSQMIAAAAESRTQIIQGTAGRSPV